MRNQNLSEKTIAEHSRNLVKFQKKGGLLNWTQDKTITFIIDHYANGSSQKSITSTLSKYRHYRGKSTDIIREFLRKTNSEASLLQQKKMTF